jgi:hypothetical protein
MSQQEETVIASCVNLPTRQSKEVEAIWNSIEIIKNPFENYRKGFFPDNSS